MLASFGNMVPERQSLIWENARRLSWVLAAAALLLACGNHYYDAKARAMRVQVDDMARERNYLERVTHDFERVLEDVAMAAASNGSLRLLLKNSGYDLKLTTTSSGAPAPGAPP